MSVKKPVIDLGYRPQSYFWPITHDTHVIAAIKGERRRSAIRDAFDADSVTPLDAFYATPTLPDEDRRALGRLHPSFMGGEYLPDRRDTEVEIARINIDSTTSDVTSIYAKAGKDRIRYRVVDEYNGDTLTAKRTRSSKRPLSLGELIDFFLAAWPLQEVLEMNELDRDGAQDFTRPSSEVYPQFAAGIRARIDGWCGEGDEEGGGRGFNLATREPGLRSSVIANSSTSNDGVENGSPPCVTRPSLMVEPPRRPGWFSRAKTWSARLASVSRLGAESNHPPLGIIGCDGVAAYWRKLNVLRAASTSAFHRRISNAVA